MSKYSFIGDILPDLSVSRPSSRLHWGIPVPQDSSQTIYVWLDALINYLTAAGYPDKMEYWPPACHVIGKDILKFHAIYWPAFLLAAGIELPRKILCHSHWTVDGAKMSKSKGNVVDPTDYIDQYTTDGLRYFLLRQAVPHADINFSEQQITTFLNVELSNTLGNLVNRITSTKINAQQGTPDVKFDYKSAHLSDHAKLLIDQLEQLPEKVKGHYEDFNYYLGIDAIMETLRTTNEYISKEEPWVLKKTDTARLDYVLILSLESVRISGILLGPIVPNLSKRLLKKLGVSKHKTLWHNAEKFCWADNETIDKAPKFSEDKLVLFPKV